LQRESEDKDKQLSIRGLGLLVVTLLVLEYVPTYFLVSTWRQNLSWATKSIPLYYPASLVYVSLLMIGVITITSRRISPIRRLFEESERHRILRNAFIGIGVGLLLSVAVSLIIFRIPVVRLFASTVLSCPFCFRTAFFVVLLVIVLPVGTEIVYRLIVQETLMRFLRPIETVLIVAFLFALLWPVFGFWVGFALGVATSVLYYFTGSLLACVLANSTATVCVGLYVIYVAAHSRVF
jgi:membrane protease YdiL (CAAX protease family)